MAQTIEDVVAEGPYVLHDPFRIRKNIGIDALQNEFFHRRAPQGHQKSMMDVPIAKRQNLYDQAFRFELIGSVGNQGLSRCSFIF